MEFSAHCLMNFARINPPDALNKIMGIFPYVRLIAAGAWSAVGAYCQNVEQCHE
jgi:hypothetical protein